jgi:hypothetical protein
MTHFAFPQYRPNAGTITEYFHGFLVAPYYTIVPFDTVFPRFGRHNQLFDHLESVFSFT